MVRHQFVKVRAMFASRSRAVKKRLRRFLKCYAKFSAMNSAWPCYTCKESLSRMKIDWEHIYDKHVNPRDADGVSLFDSCVHLPEISINSKQSSRKEFWKKKLSIPRKDRGGSFITAPLIFQWVLFQIDVDVDIMEPVVWNWYAPPQDAVIIFVVVFYPRL